MKHYLRKNVAKMNAKEQKRQEKKLVTQSRDKEADFRKMLANILSGIYTKTEKAVSKHVTSALDRKALMEELDKLFGRKKVGSKIHRI